MIKVNEKGITLVTLVITVMLLVIITSILAVNSYTSLKLSSLTKLKNDIESLESRISSYYIKEGRLPTYENPKTKSELRKILNDMSVNDGDNYYTINLEELDNLSLNYGSNWKLLGEDRYIINEESHVIYYVKGITYEGEEYHTIGSNSPVT